MVVASLRNGMVLRSEQRSTTATIDQGWTRFSLAKICAWERRLGLVFLAALLEVWMDGNNCRG